MSAPKEIELPPEPLPEDVSLNYDYESSPSDYEVQFAKNAWTSYDDSGEQECGPDTHEERVLIAFAKYHLTASLTREREKDKEIARLKAALEEAVAIFNGELGSDWADSFYPFWRMCEGIFIERMPDRATYRDAKRADDLQQRAEKAVQTLNEDANSYGVHKAIKILTAPKENSNAG